ncbi:hypothetical protein [Frigoribacterium sp. PhB118]|uniref:hypothetical protein n=1 Tax=Frigoribacterium sp. PhB118 TaxID=2485175 RepID=UPI000F4ABE4A|nr:hypothetical protein [Frigoribacterium sp. PhB118]ROS57195.1 hypothetical protein EDF21_0850 [Frigoribacterium sp. PhB118]
MANRPGTQASIGNGQTLNADAAIYWRLLVAAVAALCGVWVVATEGTRTWQRQFYLWVNRLRPGFNPAWHPDDPRANHVAGRCVDVGSGVGYVATAVSKAFYRLAGLYGFRATVPGERWHFEWRLEWVSPAIRAMVGSTPASTSTPPAPIRTDDDEMISTEAQTFIRDTVRAVVTRDSRYRLYRNSDTQKLVAVRWDVPVGDPARVIYPNDDAHAKRLRDPYQVLGDDPSQAKALSPQEWESLHRLIDGSDIAYQPK